jgi:hypothetical protein
VARRVHQDRSEGTDGDVSERFLADLRGLVWKHIGPGGDFSELAEKAKLNETTISRMMWHSDKLPQTKFPQFLTVVKLLTALGRRDLLAKAFAGAKPIKRGQTQR